MNVKGDPDRARGDLGRRVAHRRDELGLTQEQLAERAGMAAGYIDYLERNPPNLSREALNRLAEALHTSPEALLGAALEEPPGAHATRVQRPLMRELTSQECMDLLRPGGVGRIAFVIPGEAAPTVLPVNFLLHGDSIVFRTEAYGVIAEHAAAGHVSFEVDQLDGAVSEGWSVLAVGRARPVNDPAELSTLRATAPVQPWASGERDLFVTIVPAKITGRRIENATPP